MAYLGQSTVEVELNQEFTVRRGGGMRFSIFGSFLKCLCIEVLIIFLLTNVKDR